VVPASVPVLEPPHTPVDEPTAKMQGSGEQQSALTEHVPPLPTQAAAH
jgi:hypothetical protein